MDTDEVAVVVLVMPGDGVVGVNIADVVVHRERDAAFVAAYGPSGPMVIIAPPALVEALGEPVGAVNITRHGLQWSVTPSSVAPLSRWPSHVDLHAWVERAFGPVETGP